MVCEKPNRARGSGYLSKRYGKDRSTPLSPYSRVSTDKMKLMWRSIGKSMDTQIDHVHMGIKTCLENEQNGSGCVPGTRMSDTLS